MNISAFLAAWFYVNTIEYFYHRFVLHRPGNVVHAQHHRDFFDGSPGDESRGLITPTGGFVLLVHLAVLVVLPIPDGTALAVGGGLLSYAVLLELIHEWAHRHACSWLSAWHQDHHWYAVRKFNVFLPVWDLILGTY